MEESLDTQVDERLILDICQFIGEGCSSEFCEEDYEKCPIYWMPRESSSR